MVPPHRARPFAEHGGSGSNVVSTRSVAKRKAASVVDRGGNGTPQLLRFGAGLAPSLSAPADGQQQSEHVTHTTIEMWGG
jgi:hypothetical protein